MIDVRDKLQCLLHSPPEADQWTSKGIRAPHDKNSVNAHSACYVTMSTNKGETKLSSNRLIPETSQGSTLVVDDCTSCTRFIDQFRDTMME